MDASDLHSNRAAMSEALIKAMSTATYADAIRFASRAILVMDKRRDLQPVVDAALRRAIMLRDGEIDGGRYFRTDVLRAVVSEVIERGVRLFASELAKADTLPDADIERIERHLSDICAASLAVIEDWL
jgi:hypothetical protein